jgi:uncharacterized protein (DUF1697 family)
MVAFLRAVNVGGRRVPMRELPARFESLGHTDVSTYLQSGNVLFTSSGADRPRIGSELEAALADAYGIDVGIVLRDGPSMSETIAANPYHEAEADTKTLHVVFLDRAPSADSITSADPDRSPPDRFEVIGREVFVNYPGGSGRSKLTLAWLERALGVSGTARNWNTVNTIADRL